jgi:hypothetical protein
LKGLIFLGVILMLAYGAGYLAVRSTYAETWAADGAVYVIFPVDGWLYYLFRPATYIDATLTGQQFHLGPHE